jgi:2-haloacid dehalogenase
MARWVTFDCFGTLVDWHGGFASAIRPVCGAKTAAVLEAYHRHEPPLECQVPHKRYRDVLTSALLLAASDAGVAMTPTQAHALPDAWASLRLFDDAEPMLARLRAMDLRLGVLTNCDDDLFAVTQRNFARPFDLVVTAEQIGSYKPAHAHFQEFARRTRVERADWVHVACSWSHDIAPTRDLGIYRIWLDREKTDQDPATASAYVTTAAEVPDAVATLLGWK